MVEYSLYTSEPGQDPAADVGAILEAPPIPAACEGSCRAWTYEAPHADATLSLREYGDLTLNTAVYVSVEGSEPARRFAEQHSASARLTPAGVGLVNGFASIRSAQGNAQMGVQIWEQVLVDHPDDAGVLNNLAWVYATHLDPEVRDGDRAVALAERSVALERTANGLDTLAAAQAEVGRLDLAIDTQKEAIDLATEREEFQEHLAEYEAGRPLRIWCNQVVNPTTLEYQAIRYIYPTSYLAAPTYEECTAPLCDTTVP